jgi:hypothetical protein
MLRTCEGKTILASRVVAELKDVWSRQVLFFYFKKDDIQRGSLIALLRGCLAQLTRLAPDVPPYVYQEVSTSLERVLSSPETLMMLLENVLGAIEQLWMVLDGLDECERKERKKILSWISKITSERSPARVQVFITSQDKVDIRHALSPLARSPSISLQEPGHQDDIRNYVSRKAGKRKQQFNLPTEIEQDIIYKVSRQANGKFHCTNSPRSLC